MQKNTTTKPINQNNMTPKEKAKELVDKFRKEFNWVECDYPIDMYRDIKQCTLIAVEQILSIKIIRKYNLINKYWQEVKQEIQNL